MSKKGRFMRFMFWGLVLWFPISLIFVVGADQGTFDESTMSVFGNISAAFFLLFAIGLWGSCMVRLVKHWEEREQKKNYIGIALLIFGTIIGSMIFYLIDSSSSND